MSTTKQSLAAAVLLDEAHARRLKSGKATAAVEFVKVVKALEDDLYQKAASWCCILGEYGSLHWGCTCDRDELLTMQPHLRDIPWVL